MQPIQISWFLVIVTATVLEGCEIWSALGLSSKYRYIVAHIIAIVLVEDFSKGLMFKKNVIHLVRTCCGSQKLSVDNFL